MKVVSLLIAIQLFCLIPSFACECPPLKPFDKEYTSQFDLIFLGTVDSVSPCDKQAKAIFRVEKLFKGKSFEIAEVYFDCSTSCQMNFAKGEQWIMYTNYAKYGIPEVDFCSRSRRKFTSDSLDYFIATHMLNFEQEEAQLKDMLGIKTTLQENDAYLQHELIKPKGYTLLWLLGISFVLLFVALWFFKAFKK